MGERRSVQMAPLVLACPHRRSCVTLLMLLCEVSVLQMKGITEMLYCTGNQMFWGYSSLTTHVDGAFLFLAKFEGFSFLFFFCSWTQIQFSLLQAATDIAGGFSRQFTGFIGKYQLHSSISEWHPTEIFIFPQQDLFGSSPGLCLFPVLLEFSWRSHFSWLPAFTALTWAARSQVHLPTQRAACHSFPISLLKELGFVYHFVPSLSNIYQLTEVSW